MKYFIKACSKNPIVFFDVIAFAALFVFYIYFTAFFEQQWLTNEGVLRWESSNNRSVLFIYISGFLYFVARLTLNTVLKEGTAAGQTFPCQSMLGIKAPWWAKASVIAVFTYVCVAAVFLPVFNNGYGAEHVVRGLNTHMLVSLAPISQALEHGKTLYLDTPTQYAPGTLFLVASLQSLTEFTAADIYRLQLLINLAVSLVFIVVVIGATGPVIGGIIAGTLFLPFSIFTNFSFPGWGFMHRWMLMPITGIVLARVLIAEGKSLSTYLKLLAAAVLWSISSFISQEAFGGGLLAFSLIFILIIRYQSSSFREHAQKYLFFLGAFALCFAAIVVFSYGIERAGSFFALYTEFSGRVFAGASSLFLTDTFKLSQNPTGLLFVGIIYFGIIVLGASIYIILTAERNYCGTYDASIFVALVSCALASNLSSYFRSDAIHIRSSAFLMLPVFMLFIFFYLRWCKQKTATLNLITFFTVVLLGSLIWHSRGSIADTLGSAASKPSVANVVSWLMVDRSSRAVDVASFNISPADTRRMDAYRQVLHKVSSLPAEQAFAIETYRPYIIRAAELRLALSGKPLLPYLPGVARPEKILFLSGLASSTRITSPIVSVWTVEDKEKWQHEAQSAEHTCVSTDVPQYHEWLSGTEGESGAIEYIALDARVSGSSTHFACR